MSQPLTALLVGVLHIFQSPFIFCQDYSQFLVVAVRLHIRHHSVLYHTCVLTESKGAKGLLELISRWSYAKHDSCPRVPAKWWS